MTRKLDLPGTNEEGDEIGYNSMLLLVAEIRPVAPPKVMVPKPEL